MNRCLKGNKENIEQINTYDHMIQDERVETKINKMLTYY